MNRGHPGVDLDNVPARVKVRIQHARDEVSPGAPIRGSPGSVARHHLACEAAPVRIPLPKMRVPTTLIAMQRCSMSAHMITSWNHHTCGHLRSSSPAPEIGSYIGRLQAGRCHRIDKSRRSSQRVQVGTMANPTTRTKVITAWNHGNTRPAPRQVPLRSWRSPMTNR